MNRYLTEAIGTFFLVFVIGMTAVAGEVAAPLAIGSVLMVMVYMGGPVSGGHYNPAVSMGAWLRGALPTADVIPYLAAQIFGAWLAAGAVYIITGVTFAPAPGPGVGVVAMLLSEILFTFALVLVVLNTATAEATVGNSYFGLAIGFTVMVGAYAVGPISGGAFNPAVGIGPTMVDVLSGGGTLGNLWLYLVGPLVGGAAAVPVFRMQHEAAAGE